MSGTLIYQGKIYILAEIFYCFWQDKSIKEGKNNMKMDIVAGSGNDEFMTPKFAVRPIMKYLNTGSKIWCPFDTEESNYVKLLTEAGHYVYCTHIATGTDFFTAEVPFGTDYIISNPHYSQKTEVLERLFNPS